MSVNSLISGALVRMSANQNISPDTTWVTLTGWDTEVYDENPYGTERWHDNVTNPSRLTVPPIFASGYEYFVKVSALIAFDDEDDNVGQRLVRILKNGAAFPGGGNQDHIPSLGAQFVHVTTLPLLVAPGDYFQIQAQFFSPAVNDIDIVANPAPDFQTWYGIEVVGVKNNN